MSRRPEKTATLQPPRLHCRAAAAVCGLLLLLVWVVFARTIDYGFVNYDDELNLYGNPAILHGLSGDGIRWAWTTTHGSQWAPVTWMSYLADYQLFGLKPQGFHRTNVLLHSATTLLLFLVLWRMTGQLWPCGFVAAVFAVHPLHVETVAWLSERKGLLGGLFFVFALAAYVEYVRRAGPVRWLAYLAMLLSFTLGLMSKPIVVTLPFVLLLLDYWPLGRMTGRWNGADHAEPRTAVQRPPQRLNPGSPLAVSPGVPLWLLLVEKAPLLLLTVASCLIAPWAQGRAVIALAKIPLSARIGNALVSYIDYLSETLWPIDLAPFYPHPLNSLPAWKPLLAAVILLGVTVAVLARRRRSPYLPVGWLWYVGTLVPAIGLVQIGVHAKADRYMYLPQIGLCLALTWATLAAVRSRPHRLRACGMLASLAIIALAACAARQASYWRDSETLWTHAIACTPPNSLACSNLAGELVQQKRFSDAIRPYEAALRIDPNDAVSHCGLGNALLGLGKAEKATARYQQAAAEYQQAIRIRPEYVEAHSNLGNTLARLGRLDDAIAQYEAALKISPERAEIRHNLDVVRAIRARQRAN